MRDAMRAHDSRRTTTLRMALAAAHNQRIARGRELTDEEVTEVVGREVKQRRESIEIYRERRPRRSSGGGGGGGRDPLRVPAGAADRRRDRDPGTRGDRRDRCLGTRRHREGHGSRRSADEGACRRTAGQRDRSRPALGRLGTDVHPAHARPGRSTRRHRPWPRADRHGSRRAGAVPRAVGEHHGRPGEPGGRARSPRATFARSATRRSPRRAAPRRRRAQAADEVVPVTETIKSPTDNQEDQLLAYDTMARRVARVLELRDRGSLEGDEVIDRLSNDAPLIPFAWRQPVADIDTVRWEAIAAAGRTGVGTILADPDPRGRAVRGPHPRPRPRHHRSRGRRARAGRRPGRRLRRADRDHRRGGDRRAGRPGPGRGAGGRGDRPGRPADRQRGRPDHGRAVRGARRARPDPAAGRGRDGRRTGDRVAADRLAARRLPVALRAGDLVPESVRPALLPGLRGQRGRDADRRRPHPARRSSFPPPPRCCCSGSCCPARRARSWPWPSRSSPA